MRKLALALCLAPSLSWADHALPSIPDGLMLVMSGGCVDKVTREKGACATFVDATGTYYIMFVQDDDIRFIRKIVGDGYEEIYAAHDYAVY